MALAGAALPGVVTGIRDKARTAGRHDGTTSVAHTASAAHTAMTLDEHRAVVSAIEAGDATVAGTPIYVRPHSGSLGPPPPQGPNQRVIP